MQNCRTKSISMSIVLGLENEVVENICDEIKEVVVPINYNCPGQLVISGSNEGIDIDEKLIEARPRRAFFKTSCRWTPFTLL